MRKTYIGSTLINDVYIGLDKTIINTPPKLIYVDYVIAAGGGGGGATGAGGGGGQVITNFYTGSKLGLSERPYTITVGERGYGGITSASLSTSGSFGSGSNGGDSILSSNFNSLTALGGGGGAGFYDIGDAALTGSNGGSGGGSIQFAPGGIATGSEIITAYGNDGGVTEHVGIPIYTGSYTGSAPNQSSAYRNIPAGGGGALLASGSWYRTADINFDITDNDSHWGWTTFNDGASFSQYGVGGYGGEPLVIDWLPYNSGEVGAGGGGSGCGDNNLTPLYRGEGGGTTGGSGMGLDDATDVFKRNTSGSVNSGAGGGGGYGQARFGVGYNFYDGSDGGSGIVAIKHELPQIFVGGETIYTGSEVMHIFTASAELVPISNLQSSSAFLILGSDSAWEWSMSGSLNEQVGMIDYSGTQDNRFKTYDIEKSVKDAYVTKTEIDNVVNLFGNIEDVNGSGSLSGFLRIENNEPNIAFSETKKFRGVTGGTGFTAGPNSVILDASGSVYTFLPSADSLYLNTVENTLSTINKFTSNSLDLDTDFRYNLSNESDWRVDTNTPIPGRADVNGYYDAEEDVLWVGGTFNSGSLTGSLAKINTDGIIEEVYGASSTDASNITTIDKTSDGYLILGGYFRDWDGTSVNKTGVLKVDLSGSIDGTFGTSGCVAISGSVFKAVNVVKVDSNDDIYVGGNFSEIGGLSRNGIVRLNSNGSIDNGYNVGTGATSGSVNVRAIQDIQIDDEGKVWLTDMFEYSGSYSPGVVRTNTNGTVHTAFPDLIQYPNSFANVGKLVPFIRTNRTA